jgi:type I restriction enzyme, S subunit
MNKKNFLRSIPLSEFLLWDVKRYLIADIKSNFPIYSLSNLITERKVKMKPNENPEDEFGILGVSNKIGLFDAYIEKGANINQPYKIVLKDDLVYNPYRVNVGSIGIKTDKHKSKLISPAYVVFSCNEKLLPEFLYNLFKTETFNKSINDNTTGSVRQNLTFSALSRIQIPLPSLKDQKELILKYNSTIELSEKQLKDALEIEARIEDYLYKVLGIERIIVNYENIGFSTISFKEVDRWAVETLGKINKVENKFQGKYQLVKLRDLIQSYQYGLSEKSTIEKNGFPMLRMNNINNSKLDITDIKYVKIDNDTFLKFKLNKGDLLFNRTNSKELVGKTALFDVDGEYTFASYLIRVVIDEKRADNKYINYLFNSSILQYQKDLVSRQITGQANINAREIQEFLFPLPPLNKQYEISSVIDSMKSKIKELRILAEKNRTQAIEEFENEIFI